jgi:regulator of replication initiation timing
MAKTATAVATPARGSIEFDPIDRLEDKLKRLVSLVEQMRTEQARASEENQRLTREIDTLRGRLASSESLSSELSALKDERNVIRSRVSEMLDQLEALNL